MLAHTFRCCKCVIRMDGFDLRMEFSAPNRRFKLGLWVFGELGNEAVFSVDHHFRSAESKVRRPFQSEDGVRMRTIFLLLTFWKSITRLNHAKAAEI